ncbi:NAD(P)/FAD-dependent oxidoreductase [Saccharopolyspora phatthalungensis]|uniref:NADH dehydrogenase FAD-containing subunit n=1 Tax=Saccharopolyspora phatthalungensis TaxID=664693 RepID=A0A840QH58_9PSEU|nr:FAD-dependent oxidoreductase [Saccharopolyspora phatthalungensis]MBB5157979.1 NADH dehydrogenase FAD-containing subunit [Saccharopolyspora phatthalungensis]
MAVRIVVVGAGYAGLAAAKLAARWTEAAVTLVNAGDRFVERVRLHQLATGQTLRDLRLADLVERTGVKLVVGRVTAIDAEQRVVRLASSPKVVHYDLLVYALGSAADMESVPGVAEHAYTVATADEALRLRQRLGDSHVVAVVGGGLTGIEAAAELAEAHPGLKVRFVNAGALGAGLSQRGREYLRRTFDRLGVEVREQARVSEVRADGPVLADGEHLAADTVVWTAGFKVPELARAAGFAADDHGRLIVDDMLRSVSHPEVTGVGDAAAVRMRSGQELRMACATGLPSTQHAMRAIADRLAGRTPRPLRFRYLNQCISLGRRDALIQFVHADDSPRESVLTGRKAALYKEAIVRGTVLFERHPVIPTSF